MRDVLSTQSTSVQKGVRRNITHDKRETCERCYGSGQVITSGLDDYYPSPYPGDAPFTRKCPDCHGTGRKCVLPQEVNSH